MGTLEKRSKAERFIIKTIFWLLALVFVYDLFVGPEEVTTPRAAGKAEVTSTPPAVGMGTTLKGYYEACISEELLYQIMLAAGAGDTRGYEYLSNNGCIYSEPGTPVSVLEYSWIGAETRAAKVRVYADDGTITDMWTYSINLENVDR